MLQKMENLRKETEGNSEYSMTQHFPRSSMRSGQPGNHGGATLGQQRLGLVPGLQGGFVGGAGPGLLLGRGQGGGRDGEHRK